MTRYTARMSKQPGLGLRLFWPVAVVSAILWQSPPLASAYDFEWIGKIEYEAKQLSDPEVSTRRRAVTALARYDIQFTKKHLLKAVTDRDQRVRFEAGLVLAKHKVLAAVPLVIDWLSIQDNAVKQDAATVLAEFATPEAVATLIRMLGEPEDRVRRIATAALGDVGTAQVVVPLIGRLEDDKSDVRKEAVDQLARLGDQRAVIPLVGAFSDSNTKVRKAAVLAIGQLGGTEPVPALLRLLRDSDLRVAAVTSLGNLHAVEATDTLIADLGRATDNYGIKIAYSLGQIARAVSAVAPDQRDQADLQAAERAVRALVRVLAVPGLRIAGKEALRNAGTVAVPALIALLSGELEGDLTTAIELLRDIGDSRATPALVQELERGRVPYEAVLQALETCGDQRALIPITNLLKSTDSDLRMRALVAMRSVIVDDRAADALLALLDDKQEELRILAVEYLGLMRARSAVPKLIELTKPGLLDRLRLAAVDALGEIADPRANDALVRILEQGPSQLRQSAANSLMYIGTPDIVDRLLVMVRNDEADYRAQALRAMVGILRAREHKSARQYMESLATEGDRELSLNAIDGLGAMGDKRSVPRLIELLGADSHRQRAAATALGNLADPRAIEPLIGLLRVRDDRVSSAAAWALGKLADGASKSAVIEVLVKASKRRGWATVINASASLAMLATDQQTIALTSLLYHQNRLVRANAAAGLGRVLVGKAKNCPRNTCGELGKRARDDDSPLVRMAAIRALSTIGTDRNALDSARKSDRHQLVRKAADALAKAPFAPVERTDWRNFQVVDRHRSDAPIRQEPYFLLASDGLITAYYTDLRGSIIEEQFPPGEYLLLQRNERNKY